MLNSCNILAENVKRSNQNAYQIGVAELHKLKEQAGNLNDCLFLHQKFNDSAHNFNIHKNVFSFIVMETSTYVGFVITLSSDLTAKFSENKTI